jgi:hypothetical protein
VETVLGWWPRGGLVATKIRRAGRGGGGEGNYKIHKTRRGLAGTFSQICPSSLAVLSVLGLVPTLTSELCCDKPLDGWCKSQHKDTSLSCLRPRGRKSSRVCVRTVLIRIGGARRGRLEAMQERRRSL